MKKVLFIAVHPDDETLGCGGTIIKHKIKNDKVYWLIITAPTLNHPFGFSNKFISVREKLIEKISFSYRFEKVYNLKYPTQLMHNIDIRELILKIGRVFDEVKPQIIYLCNRSDVHSDHRVSFDAAFACTKNFRRPFIEKILMYETLSETEFSPPLLEKIFAPNIYVDITKQMEKKIRIMRMYKTEIMPTPMPRSIKTIEALARFRGTRIGVNYAESFMLLFEKC